MYGITVGVMLSTVLRLGSCCVRHYGRGHVVHVLTDYPCYHSFLFLGFIDILEFDTS